VKCQFTKNLPVNVHMNCRWQEV